MQALAALLMTLFGSRAERVKRHAGAQVALAVAVAMCAVAASVYGLAFLTLWLASRIGLMPALAAGCGGFAVAALLAALAMQAESRRNARRRAEEAARERDMVMQAALAALGGAGGRKSALVLALAALAAGLVAGRGRGGDGDGDGEGPVA